MIITLSILIFDKKDFINTKSTVIIEETGCTYVFTENGGMFTFKGKGL